MRRLLAAALPRADKHEHPGGRVLLVTGASSGIGRAVARQAAAAGDHLALLGRDEAALDEVAHECDAAGAASTLVTPADVGSDEEVARAFARAHGVHGRVDAVAHLAGVVAFGRFVDVPAEIFEQVLRTNLVGSANVARHALHGMRGRGEGSVVLVGSLVGHLAVPGLSPYVVSKWGVRALARQLQLENRDLPGVSVSYLAPGPATTPIWRSAASYTGWSALPPPPADAPERVARAVLQRVENPRPRTQVGLANGLARAFFSAAPAIYDAVAAPLLERAMTDHGSPRAPGAGNVLSSRPVGRAVVHDYPGAVRRLAHGLGGRP